MIKITLITLMGVGALGTGSQAIAPQSVALTTGTVTIKAASDGIKTDIATKPELSLRVETKGGRIIRVRF